MNIYLKETCFACPEQYDAIDIDTGENVAYLRLRHGYFYVDCPWGGERVFESYPKGDGRFIDEYERKRNLERAERAILNFYRYK